MINAPLNEIAKATKNSSDEIKTFVFIIGVGWLAVTIFSAFAQYRLSKANLKLVSQQSKKLESEGFKPD